MSSNEAIRFCILAGIALLWLVYQAVKWLAPLPRNDGSKVQGNSLSGTVVILPAEEGDEDEGGGSDAPIANQAFWDAMREKR